jgi:hypothetical protein
MPIPHKTSNKAKLKQVAISATATFATCISLYAAASCSANQAHANPGDSEDAPSFSCVLDGNHVCGPHNSMGAVPGLYMDGKLIQTWPTVKNCYAIPTPHCSEDWLDVGQVYLGTISQYSTINPGGQALLNEAS